jgi:hypothetical protein
LGAEVEATLRAVKGELTTRVKQAIERKSGEKLEASETFEWRISIDGNKLQKGRTSWVDSYRTGTVEVTHDGKVYKVPFELPIRTRVVFRNAGAR